ncbi:MAG: putative Ig domain-containing protein [Actinomycetes bacterium]
MNNKMNNKERGDSLLEVVISTVIMGMIGVLLVSSIAVARPFADKMSLVGQTVQNLNTMAESINLQPFTFCTPTNPQPYGLSATAQRSSTPSTNYAIATTSLPPVVISTPSKQYNYSAQLSTDHAIGSVTWSVEPALPSGLTLNPDSGLITGKISKEFSSQHLFTASNGAQKATKTLELITATLQVQVNNGLTWIPCEASTIATISGAQSDGKFITYSYSGKQFVKGESVTIWGSSNPAFDGNSLAIVAADSNSFTVATTISKGISSSGGQANISSQINIQQVVLTTSASGSPLQKVVTKALA